MFDSRTPDPKRKRTFSNQTSPSQRMASSDNHLLYQKLIDMSKELEAEKMKNLQPGPIPRENPSLYFQPQNIHGITPRQNLATQPPRLPNHYAMFPGSVAGQAQPNNGMTGQAHPTVRAPLQVPGWEAQSGSSQPQWGAGQDFYPANH